MSLRPPTTDEKRAVVEFLGVHPECVPADEVIAKAGLDKVRTRLVLTKLREAEIADVWGNASRGAPKLWGLWKNVARLRAAKKAAGDKARGDKANAKRKAKHDAAKLTAYEKLLLAPDMPVKQHRTNNWTPVRQAPGPISIFDLGARHA